MALILIAEDESSISSLIEANLRLVGHECVKVAEGSAALAEAQTGNYDLILLDVMLPVLDGFAVKTKLPPEQPVIFVTAKVNVQDRVMGLQLGADDYIIKPFDIVELVARVEAVLRRTSRNNKSFCLGQLTVDMAGRTVQLAGQPVELTPQEYSLLETLIINRNLALSREQLLQLAWGFDYGGETRTVDVHIQRLRKKLGLERNLQTVYKLGYRLNTRII